MTRRDKYNFILYSFLPALEHEGMTVKTTRDGEWTLRADDPLVAEFVASVRNRITAALSQPSLPHSPYGNGL
ncbi:hypothetical protein FR257_11945 [Salmonella enterica subsp. enterica]|nr:hypothetical protein [Salmonella enterica subsp. enterica serovar Agbeni]ECL0916769.1 hypothetical protein [Salmonella enterica subsp. enterica serovar Agbeni]